jgi:2-phospho-L-lactate/phosphoenolpyruvate guanylyltransferase
VQADKLFVIVPIKDPAQGKSRLSTALDASRRHALNTALARHTVEVCVQCFGPRRTIVVTNSPEVIALGKGLGVQVADDPGGEATIDPGLRSAAAAATERGAGGIVVIPADLPLLSDKRLREVLLRMPAEHSCLLVPDRRRDGTNVLAMTPVNSEVFSYGHGSLQRHAKRATRLGYKVLIHESDPLGLDLDLPEDLLHLRTLCPRSGQSAGGLGAIMAIVKDH